MSLTVRIAVCASGSDPFRQELLRWLKRYPQPGCEAEKALQLPTIAVLSPRLRRLPQLKLPPHSAVIFWEDSAVSADFAAAAGAQPLDLGFSHRATLTFSSMGEGKAMLSLQRPIHPLTGQTAEPMEWPIRIKGQTGAEMLLTAAAIRLLADGSTLRQFSAEAVSAMGKTPTHNKRAEMQNKDCKRPYAL